MGVNTAGNARYLRGEFLVSRILTIMEPYLAAIDLFPSQQVNPGDRSIAYRRRTATGSADTKKETPRMRTAGARFTEVEVSEMDFSTAILNQRGFAVRFDEDIIKGRDGAEEINRAINDVGFWLVEDLNTRLFTAIVAGATASSVSPTATWDGGTATPVLDLIKFRQEMRREGYPYRMSDIFIHNDNRDELEQYLVSVDVADGKQNYVYGMPNPNTINVPAVRCNIHGLLSGVSEGTLLGVDAMHPCGTVYYNNDSEYAIPTITYEAQDYRTGNTITKTVDNFGLNIHSYKEDDSHDRVVQFWIDNVFALKEAYAVTYLSSGI